MQQIFLIFLSNAIKFTVKGEVILSIRKHQNNMFFLIVGISVASKKIVFDFSSKFNNPSSNREGIGLELVLCKKILHCLSDSEIRIWKFDIPIDQESHIDSALEDNDLDQKIGKKLNEYVRMRRKVKENSYKNESNLIINDQITCNM